MITRAIIEEKISPYKFKVRIPTFDRSKEDAIKTAAKDLSIATASIPKGVYNNLDVGDVVFVAFENNDIGLPVIIGQLYRDALIKGPQESLLNCNVLEVGVQANLPTNIKIGALDYSNLFHLINVTSDIQEQLNKITNRLNQLENK